MYASILPRNGRAVAVAALAVLLMPCASVLGQPSASEAAGYKAGIMCSAVFLAGRAPEDVLRDELGGNDPMVASVADAVIDRAARSVTVPYEEGKAPRLAVFREGLGTILTAPGTTIEEASALLRVDMPMPPGDAAQIPWPDGDLLPDEALPPEVDTKKLDAAVEAAFNGKKYEPHKTLGVVVVYKGRIIAERYAPSWTMHTQYRSWSSAKSVTCSLVGILVGQGKLKVSDPAPIPEWQAPDDARRKITLEHLLHMSSGLKSMGANTSSAYWGGIDTAAEVAKSQPDVEPDTRWKYSNYDTLLLVRSIKEVLNDDEAYLTFPRRALLNKIGMRHTFPETDPYGNFILSSQMYTTPRDLARLGLLYLRGGVWNGERILPEGWTDYVAKPAPAKSGTGWGYGAQFWLLGDDARVPADTYTTAGARGQLSTIVPSRDLVVARMGLDPRTGGKWDQVELVSDVLAAIAKKPEH